MSRSEKVVTSIGAAIGATVFAFAFASISAIAPVAIVAGGLGFLGGIFLGGEVAYGLKTGDFSGRGRTDKSSFQEMSPERELTDPGNKDIDPKQNNPASPRKSPPIHISDMDKVG